MIEKFIIFIIKSLKTQQPRSRVHDLQDSVDGQNVLKQYPL